MVRSGTASGTASKNAPSTSSTAAVPYVATRRQGSVFSVAIRPATIAIQTTLMIPSAKNDAISAQQQPTHQPPFFSPMRSAPDQPSRQEPSNRPSGLRHLPRQTSLSGVSSYAAAIRSVAAATQRPARPHENTS